MRTRRGLGVEVVPDELHVPAVRTRMNGGMVQALLVVGEGYRDVQLFGQVAESADVLVDHGLDEDLPVVQMRLPKRRVRRLGALEPRVLLVPGGVQILETGVAIGQELTEATDCVAIEVHFSDAVLVEEPGLVVDLEGDDGIEEVGAEHGNQRLVPLAHVRQVRRMQERVVEVEVTAIERVVATLHDRFGMLLPEPERHAEALELGVDERTRTRQNEQVLGARRLQKADEIARRMCPPREIEVTRLWLVPDPRDVRGDGSQAERADASQARRPGIGAHAKVVHLPG